MQRLCAGLPWIEQLLGPEAMLQSTSAPAGSGSLMTTPVAAPVPGALLLLAVTVNPIGDPAFTEAASAVLARLRSGHSTRVVASSLGEPTTLVALTVAVLGYTPSWLGPPRQEFTTVAPEPVHCVGLVTCTVSCAPAANEPVQLNAPAAIEQDSGPVWLAIVQVIPGPLGSGSLTSTPLAVPAPVFVAVTVNPIGEPALTEGASASFTIDRPGHSTDTVATSLSRPVPLVVLIVALFFTTPQSAGEVGELTWMTGSEPGPFTWVNVQSRTWLPTAPVIEQPL